MFNEIISDNLNWKEVKKKITGSVQTPMVQLITSDYQPFVSRQGSQSEINGLKAVKINWTDTESKTTLYTTTSIIDGWPSDLLIYSTKHGT